jgi:hypothetical protein
MKHCRLSSQTRHVALGLWMASFGLWMRNGDERELELQSDCEEGAHGNEMNEGVYHYLGMRNGHKSGLVCH